MEDSGIDSEDRQSNIYEDGAAGLLVSDLPTTTTETMQFSTVNVTAENGQRSPQTYVGSGV